MSQPEESDEHVATTVRLALKYHGLNDYGTFFQVQRAAELLENTDESNVDGLMDLHQALELYNAQLFIKNGVYPASCEEGRRERLRRQARTAMGGVGRFFRFLTNETLPQVINGAVHHDYRSDLVNLLMAHRVDERCTPDLILTTVMDNAEVDLSNLLMNRRLVDVCDKALRERLLSSPSNAEPIIKYYLESPAGPSSHLPSSLTLAEMRGLVERYLDGDAFSPNYVELITQARVRADGVVTPQIKLKALRTHREWTGRFFERNGGGMSFGSEVSVDPDQLDPVVERLDGMMAKYTYGLHWLESTLDNASILNNFMHLFDFTSTRVLLTLPSYQAERGTLASLFEVSGRESYPTGAAFRVKQAASLLQTAMYDQFLKKAGVELEVVVKWFFTTYLSEEFGVESFLYSPSSTTATYLERCRHVFVEMESVVRQFSLFAQTGEMDAELLYMTSEQVRYKNIEGLVPFKYVYPRPDGEEISRILHLLFSDQSHMTYLSGDVSAVNLVRLVLDHDLNYSDFDEYQVGNIDFLVARGLLQGQPGGRVTLGDKRMLTVLREIQLYESTNYYRYSAGSRVAIDEMVVRGWLERRSSLLSESEAQYFNYYLNQVDYSNGPDLRNHYLHGSNPSASQVATHANNYYRAMSLLLCLVVKMNDDFCLRSDEAAPNATS